MPPNWSFFLHFLSSLNHQCPPNRINHGPSISRERQPTITPLRSGQSHMSAGDSADDLILIHALGPERLIVFSCGLRSNPLKNLCFAGWGTIESFDFRFLHTSRQMRFSTSLIGARNESPAVEWALYTKERSEPSTSSPRSEFTTLSLFSSNEVCGAHEITPRLIRHLLWECLRPMLAKIAARNPFFPENWKVPKNITSWAGQETHNRSVGHIFWTTVTHCKLSISS